MTVTKLYQIAARNGLIVNNLFQLNNEIWGAYVSGDYAGHTTSPRFGYAQGTRAASALEKAIDISIRRQESKS